MLPFKALGRHHQFSCSQTATIALYNHKIKLVGSASDRVILREAGLIDNSLKCPNHIQRNPILHQIVFFIGQWNLVSGAEIDIVGHLKPETCNKGRYITIGSSI